MNERLAYSRKRTLGRHILETIAHIGLATVDGFFPKKYAQARIWRKALGLDDSHTFSKPTFSMTLGRLQEQGLVSRTGSKKTSLWQITKKGREYLEEHSMEMPAPDGMPRIVIFDIPEKERGKRTWLRSELVIHHYRQLQRSVWIGETPLREDFLKMIDTLRIGKYVHIFSVNKTGTIGPQ